MRERRLTERAQTSFQQGDYDSAKDFAQQALDLNEEDESAYKVLLDSYRMEENYTALLQVLSDAKSHVDAETAASFESDVINELSRAAVKESDAGNLQRAIDYYGMIVTAAGDDREKAEPARQKITELEQKLAKEASGADAAAAWKAVLEDDPDNIQALEGLSESDIEAGDYDEAEETLLHLIELEPEESSWYDNLADVYIKEEKFDEAEEILEKGYQATGEKNLEKRESAVLTARARAAEGEDAIALWKQVIKETPGLVEAYSSLADLYVEEGDYESALEILEKGQKKTGDALLTKRISQVRLEMAQKGIAQGDLDGNPVELLDAALSENDCVTAIRIMATKEFQDAVTDHQDSADGDGKLVITADMFPAEASEEAADGSSTEEDQETAENTQEDDEELQEEEEEEPASVTLTLDAENKTFEVTAEAGVEITENWPAYTDELERVVIGIYGGDENEYGTYVLADGTVLSSAQYFASFSP